MSIRRANIEIKDLAKEHILHHLPAKTLFRFRSVSNEWCQKIKGPLMPIHQSNYFRELSGFLCEFNGPEHDFLGLNPAYGIPDPSLKFIPGLENITIKSSSGGLLLIEGQNADSTSYYICNPATMDWKKLPEPCYYHVLGTAAVLAFEPSLLNIDVHYQVICAVPLLDNKHAVCFEVYSSETNSWTQSPAWCFDLGESSFTGNGFYMKGNAYWLTTSKEVLAFDVEGHTYDIIPLPPGCPRGGVLSKMQDEICYIGVLRASTNEYSIKIYGGMDFGLKLCINVPLDQMELSDESQAYRVLPCLDAGQVMILVKRWLYWYRLSDGRAELISKKEVGSSWVAKTYLPYVNTLAPVN